MIKIEEAKAKFLEETKQYDLTNLAIARKQSHSLRVMENAKEIATRMKLTPEQIKLATIIGLLHDIARFEQYTKFGTYSDQDSFDHGDRAVEVLKEGNKLREYLPDSQYDSIIFTAIQNHNKYAIAEGLTAEELLFSKIIRDADKLDIFQEACEVFWKDETEIAQINTSSISKEVQEQVEQEKTVLRKKGRKFNHIDAVIELLALVFDLNETASFQILQQQQYLEKTIQKFQLEDPEEQEKLQQIGQKIIEYAKRKAK